MFIHQICSYCYFRPFALFVVFVVLDILWSFLSVSVFETIPLESPGDAVLNILIFLYDTWCLVPVWRL